jgi:hypothetical protein
MAGKPINIEDTKPSYDEVINELLSMISKLVMENSIMKVTIKKFEDAVQLVKEEPQQEKN